MVLSCYRGVCVAVHSIAPCRVLGAPQGSPTMQTKEWPFQSGPPSSEMEVQLLAAFRSGGGGGSGQAT